MRQVAEPLQALSVAQILPFINRLNGKGLQIFFWAKIGAGFGAEIRPPRPIARAAHARRQLVFNN